MILPPLILEAQAVYLLRICVLHAPALSQPICLNFESNAERHELITRCSSSKATSTPARRWRRNSPRRAAQWKRSTLAMLSCNTWYAERKLLFVLGY